jgi:cell division protein FtsI/penicillin-binding protein 2
VSTVIDGLAGYHFAPGTRHAKRFLLVYLLFILLGLGILGRLLYLQIWAAPDLAKKALTAHNQTKVLVNRGRILDRNGQVLAQDTLLYDVYFHPKEFKGQTPREIAQALSRIVNEPAADLERKLSQPLSTVWLFKNMPKETLNRIKDIRLAQPLIDEKHNRPVLDDEGQPVLKKVRINGLDPVKKSVRQYPQGTLAAHLLGYVNDEAEVSSGLEQSARTLLTDRPDTLPTSLQVDGAGNPVNVDWQALKTMVQVPRSQDISLTIDSRLQFVAERELKAGIERTQAERGTVIMMDPTTGEILAFAVFPSYNPEKFTEVPQQYLKNWALSDVYPPGSTMKILTVACGLESGVINKSSRILDTGRMKVGGWTIQNYDYHKHPNPGNIDLVYLFQHSSNIASAKIAMMMPKSVHYNLLDRFGMGRKTGIELPGETRGALYKPETWDLSTHATLGYGYGLMATPMQMAAAVAAIANRGIWVTPHLLKSTPIKPIVRRRVLSEQTAADLTELLRTSIAAAENSPANIAGLDVAGKTGTSRKPSENGRGYSSDLFTSFVGFFPAQKPRVLTMVVIDSPHSAEAWGSTVAAPIFRAIASETIHYLGLTPAKITTDSLRSATAANQPVH